MALSLVALVAICFLPFGTAYSWHPTSPGIRNGVTISNRRFWEFKEQDYDITYVIDVENWTRFYLKYPKLHRKAGRSLPGPSWITSATREAFATARFQSHGEKGTWGTVSWLVDGLLRRVVIMYRVTDAFYGASIALGLGVTRPGLTTDYSGWYDQMSTGQSNGDIAFKRQEFPRGPGGSMEFSHGELRMIATVTPNDHTIVTVKVMPTSVYWGRDVADSVRNRRP